jgi:hypothetical protein
MSVFLSFLSSLWGSIAGWAAKSAFLTGALAFLGPLAPIISGIAQLIGGIFTAICEIVVSLSKSAEGRVVLAILTAGLGFLYLRFHYIEEGKAIARARAVAMAKPCHAMPAERRRR